MKGCKIIALSLLLIMCAASVAMAANYVPKVDNFIILVDRSGSMDGKYVGPRTRRSSWPRRCWSV